MTENRVCPYPGLRSFNENESIYFKGRELHIEKCIDLLKKNKYLMVTGSSGDGKSSMVFAGLVPNANAGFFRGEFGKWAIVSFRPERNPLNNLAVALSEKLSTDSSFVLANLEHGFSALVDLYTNSDLFLNKKSDCFVNSDEKNKRKLINKSSNLLIIIDQFEELFTISENFSFAGQSHSSKIFINLITETNKLALALEIPIYIVCTMRSDYIGNCSSFRGLPELIGFSHYFIPRLNRTEIYQVIDEPAVLSGNYITPRLIERLLYDLKEGQDVLPVLQHALFKIWRKAFENNDEKMDLIHYAQIGGLSYNELPEEYKNDFTNWRNELSEIKRNLLNNSCLENILNAHANELYETIYEIYNKSNPNQKITKENSQFIIKTAFQCLTRLDDNKAVRNKMSISEIYKFIQKPEISIKQVAEILHYYSLPDNSLLRKFSLTNNYEKTILDITHEALIRNWKLLNEWVFEENSRIEIYLELRKQVERWKSNNKSSQYLLTLGSLNYFENWRNSFDINIIPWIQRYLCYKSETIITKNSEENSTENDKKDLTNEIFADEYESKNQLILITEFLKKSRKRINLKKNIAIASGILIFILFIFASLGYYQAQKAQKISHSNELAIQSFINLPIDPALSFRLAEKAYEVNSEGLFAIKAIIGAFYGTSFGTLIRGHNARVLNADFSHNGEYIITASKDKTAKIFDLSGKEISVMKHDNYVTFASFSNNDKFIITDSQDSLVKLYDVSGILIKQINNGSPSYYDINYKFSSDNKFFIIQSNFNIDVYNFNGTLLNSLKHNSEIIDVNLSPDNNFIVTVSEDSIVRLWNINGDFIKSFDNNQKGDFRHAIFSNNGNFIIGTTYWKRFSQIWDTSGNHLYTLRGHTHGIHDIAVTTDNKFIVTVSYDSRAIIWDYNGNLVKILIHPSNCDNVDISPDNKYIATTCRDNCVRIWDFKGNELQILSHPDWIGSVKFSNDSKSLLTSCSDKICRLWNVNNKHLTFFNSHKKEVIFSKYINNGKEILSASNDSTIIIWDTLANVLKTQIINTSIENFDISNDNKIYAVSNDKNVYVYDNSFKLLNTFKAGSHINSLKFSNNNNLLITANNDSTATVLTQNGETRFILKAHKAKVNFADFSKNDKYIITCSNDSSVIIWDSKGNLLKQLKKHTGIVLYANFTDDCNSFITCSDDKSLIIWNTVDFSPKLILDQNDLPIQKAIISSDNKYILAVMENSFKVFDTDGNELILIKRHFKNINHIEFSPDNKNIITASDDNRIIMYPIDINLMLKMININKNMGNVRNLTEKEIKEFNIE